MTHILYVTSSIRGEDSFSNRVASTLLDDLKKSHSGATVTERNLSQHPLPHIDHDYFQATRTPDGPKTAAQRAVLAKSDALVDELFKADIIVIAVPMYNFGIPSTLKTWIDYIARPGRTFSYSEKGPEGLLKGKRVILVTASGGVYSEGPYAPFEHQGSYLRVVLGFLGVTNIQQVFVEGVALGAEQAEKAVASGSERAHNVVRELIAA